MERYSVPSRRVFGVSPILGKPGLVRCRSGAAVCPFLQRAQSKGFPGTPDSAHGGAPGGSGGYEGGGGSGTALSLAELRRIAHLSGDSPRAGASVQEAVEDQPRAARGASGIGIAFRHRRHHAASPSNSQTSLECITHGDSWDWSGEWPAARQDVWGSLRRSWRKASTSSIDHIESSGSRRLKAAAQADLDVGFGLSPGDDDFRWAQGEDTP